MNEAFIKEQISSSFVLIQKYQEVLLFLANNPNKSYSFDTGQSKETVTQKDVTQIHRLIRSLIEDVEYWQDMLDGGSTIILRPGF